MHLSPARFIEARYQILFWPLLFAFVTFGTSLIIIGALLPRILQDFHWSYTAAGIVIAANSFGYFASTLASGLLVQRFGPKPVVSVGLVLLASSLFFFGVSPSVVLNLGLNFLVGVGQGTIEIVVNSSVVRMERESESHLMSFMHAAFSVGAIVGPFAIGIIVVRSLAWQGVYRVIALVALAIAVVMILLPFHRLKTAASSSAKQPRLRDLGVHPMLFLTFFALLLYVGLEVGITNWISEYFVRIFGSTASTGAFMVSLFWVGILAGRLLMPIVYRGPRIAESVLALALLLTLSLAVVVVMPGALSGGIFFFLTSLGCSAFYPRVMTLIGQYFPTGQSVVVGFAASGGGVGMFLFPLGMSAVAQSYGLRTGFILYVAMGVALAVISWLIVRETNKRRSNP